ncbi:hypothetical protein ACFLQ0_03970 [Nitrospinota bacterium]
MKRILVFIMVGLVIVLVYMENRRSKSLPLSTEACLFCHNKASDPDTSHPISAFGCYSCHMGNPYSLDKERAHLTMVKNPGNLSYVDRTCGQAKCHPQIVPRVKKSIMATNRGIIKTLEYRWEKIEKSDKDVEYLLENESAEGLAIDQYRKMCGGCHLWKKRDPRQGEIGKRGGGCSDCHIIDKVRQEPIDVANFQHPEITTRIPSENCVKCHNRSARMGLSYFGRFESEGYGTPYEGWDFNQRRLSGGRFYINLPADIHYAKARMTCIDCHTGAGIMGDGTRHEYMKDQVDITCQSCHIPRFISVKDKDSLASKLASLNKKISIHQGAQVGESKKGNALYNLQKRGNQIVFYRKTDGMPVELKIPLEEKLYHRLPGHERLACQACHSAWVPQCYGCHITYRKDLTQIDWLSGKKTPGQFRESRSYIRFSKPTLGINASGKVAPFSPCQVFVSVFDQEGNYVHRKSLKTLAMTSFDPHTTRKRSRSCQDCHGDPKSLGFGEGILYKRGESWQFRPSYDAQSSGMGIGFALDAFVDTQGTPLMSTAHKGARPFNQDELENILAVDVCLPCHDQYEDKIYRDFKMNRKRFETERDLPCWEMARKYAP